MPNGAREKKAGERCAGRNGNDAVTPIGGHATPTWEEKKLKGPASATEDQEELGSATEARYYPDCHASSSAVPNLHQYFIPRGGIHAKSATT